MDKLSYIILDKVENSSWRPMKAECKGPPISYLAFADDFLLFIEAGPDQIKVILDYLNSFCLAAS